MQINKLVKIFSSITALLLAYLTISSSYVYSQSCGGDCSVVQCNCYINEGGAQVCDWCSACGGNGCQSVTCPSGTYMTNNGCVQIGGSGCSCGEKADGSCKPCGGGAECWGGAVGCPAGSTVAWNQPVNTFCKNNDWGKMCEPIGDAQQNTGCCREACAKDNPDECWCANGQVTTYNCCPAGTADKCDLIAGPNYTWLREYVARYACQDDYDTFISTTRSDVVKWGPVTLCNGDIVYNEKKDRDECTGEWYQYIDYYYNTTCADINRVCTCQSVCSNTAPTNVNVVQGSSATSANVSWTVGTGGASQRLYVDQSQNEVNNGCPTPSACEVNATLASGTNSYIVTGLLPNTTYYFRVTNYASSTCNIGATPRSYTTPNVTLSGRVYIDTYNNCATTTPWNLGGLSVAVQGTGYSGSVGSDGRFGFYGGLSTPVNLVLSGYSASYVPSTAAGCNAGATLSSVVNPSSTNYFYLTPRREAWWRVTGGSLYSAGNVRSELPLASSELIIAGTGGALGALMQASGTLDTGAGSISSAGYAAQTSYRGKTMNYDYFAAHMGVLNSTPNDWTVNTLSKPNNNPDKDFYYMQPTTGEASVSIPWTVAAGESYVVFVNGDLRIASNITVAPGGFLAFIVNGTLRVSPATSSIQGLYVIDGTLVTESNGSVDTPANFEGSVVTWGGVNLGRDLVGDNANSPAERFTYRPDLLTNMPEAMKVFALRWEEVVPGTFGQ